jgi:hypothetical protein
MYSEDKVNYSFISGCILNLVHIFLKGVQNLQFSANINQDPNNRWYTNNNYNAIDNLE